VPVLSSPSGVPLPDSLKITWLLADKYPELIPESHEIKIRQLLIDLHALNYFSLSYPTRPQVARALESTVEKQLERNDVTARHRKALEFKLNVYGDCLTLLRLQTCNRMLTCVTECVETK
jgi:glutathione S-transferase